MLLPEKMEREHRFKLALRMGLPIFFLVGLLVFIGLSEYFVKIPLSFYMTAIVILGVIVYFIFFLIYAGFDDRITDPITRTFNRDYLISYIKKEIKNSSYTLMLISIDNLNDINERYGTNNGDRVLHSFADWIGNFIAGKRIEKFPIGRFKGGDFIIGFKGKKSDHLPLLELLCLKADSYMIDDIELQVSGAIVDTWLSKDTNQLIDHLFEQQQQRRIDKDDVDDEPINPSELEAAVINAVVKKRFSIMFQEVMEKEKCVIFDASVKLFGNEGKLLHQKKYMPVINRMGLSRSYDQMLMEHIVHLCHTCACDIKFAFSLFPSTIRNHDFFEKVQLLFTENEKAKGRVVFVLEEKEYYNQLKRFNDILQSYRRMGVLIALDRLGTNPATFQYLRELDVDMVRFDMSFGKFIHKEKIQALLRGLHTSAHYINVKSWVKMIENEEQKALSDTIGIDYVQGNSVGLIAPLEDLLEKHHEIR